MKKGLRFSISLVFAFQCLLIYYRIVSWESGVWGLVMQLLYHRLLCHFPKIDVTSPLFLSVCAGTLIHEILWFVDAPDGQIATFLRDKCMCLNSHSLGLPMCFCTGTIFALIICVWVIPLLLLFSWMDDLLMQKAAPHKRQDNIMC
uniref:Uncharacterized protein n=1 Tax=Cryptomonas curvata TaxID=233186 RepID=A0A7S0MHQ3_9CRYP|mmetsp:Transcript_41841/g.87456  ORF Transcript_41841/g.87456 Transcript_41841/m.87456 type:complete len:146 (+) Transcript_41841:133-570(+)